MIGALVALAPALLVLLTLGGLISAAETAMTGASRGRLHQLERDGDRPARRVNRLLGDQETMIGAILLSNNVVNILASALTTTVFSALFPGAIGVAAATVIMTVLIVIFAEILPKTLALTHADDVARLLSLPTLWLVRIFGPLANGAQWVVRQTLRPFGIRLGMETDVLAAHEEIRGAVEYHHSEGTVEETDRQMLGGVLDLADLAVSEIMVHRRNMQTLDADLPPRELIRAALDSRHTRLPLYRDEPENIVGVLHSKDLARAIAAVDRLEEVDLPSVMREPWFIPDTTNAKDQLAAFLQRRNHFALVVDEYGDLQGLVTLEDILEEIVGDITDEHDAPAPAGFEGGIDRAPDGSVVVDGATTIRDLNRALDWTLPDEEAVTVAGLVIHEAQTIPDMGQVFNFHRQRFQILGKERNQITQLRVWPPEPVDEDV
ncbi:MAG: HlyC/CorC family transporter [Proteobacteria bacterium]|nr:HlyC/CorC family transporter [Pseudomonadota bacterium]